MATRNTPNSWLIGQIKRESAFQNPQATVLNSVTNASQLPAIEISQTIEEIENNPVSFTIGRSIVGGTDQVGP